jgi:DNA-binding transcriptional LysR family regulator
MELRQLRYFVGVAREQSFSGAAVKLRVAQPALSRQVRLLEEELGVLLLERRARGVRLTTPGEVFLAKAVALLEQSEQAAHQARLSGHDQCGRIDVGYVWGLFHTLVPRCVADFRRQNPQVSVNLFDLTATQQAESLGRGRLDLGFIGFAFEADGARLAKKKIGQCAFMAALPSKHPAARRRTVDLRALSQDLFIVISEQTYPGAAHLLKEACSRAGFRPKTLQSVERGHTILGLVAGNCGVTLLPEPLRALPHPGVVFRPLIDPPKADLFVAWNSERATSTTRAFVDCIRAEQPSAAG